MERPPSWRIVTTNEFEAEYEALVDEEARLPQYREAWEWYLERVPERMATPTFASGDDDFRVMTWVEPHDEVEIMVGIELIYDERRVVVRWIALVPPGEDSE